MDDLMDASKTLLVSAILICRFFETMFAVRASSNYPERNSTNGFKPNHEMQN
jgi:hypothetical protein